MAKVRDSKLKNEKEQAGKRKQPKETHKENTEAAAWPLNEPESSYGARPVRHHTGLKVIKGVAKEMSVASNITGKGDRPEHQMTSFEKIELIEEGISKKALENLKEKAGLDYNRLSQVLNVARATLINKKGNEKFNKDVSDKILGLAEVYSYGYDVFEDRDRFNRWIFRPNRALGGRVPFDLLHNTFGRGEVKNLIGRIDYGVYS